MEKTFDERAEVVKAETREAIETIFGELNQGQRQKLLRNQIIIDICNRYDVPIPNGGDK